MKLSWNASELRAAFTKYFSDKGHQPVEPWPLVPAEEGLLFTIAGMVPFKPYFTGEKQPPFSRATSIQRCFRMLDIELVGTTARHNTFFEMLGNFSFGDYFKEEAISYAWEFVTQILGLDPDKLWVTVHESDVDSAKIWKTIAKVPDDRIQVMGEDNFWKMGNTGPCGPCSEIYFDKGERFGEAGGPKFGGEDRFVEIWNLVFMQYERLADGQLIPLPKPSIDTGAGLERIVALLEGVDTVFDTCLMKPIIDYAAELAEVPESAMEDSLIALRILADHARAMAFLISDGVFPSNEGRGYVLRRIIRRAAMRASYLGYDGLMTPQLGSFVAELMKNSYPKLYEDVDLITKILTKEEETFRRTLKSGENLLKQALEDDLDILSGEVAFKLHDTYGFPIELTIEMAHEKHKEVDLDAFTELMESQRARARANRKHLAENDSAYYEVLETIGKDYGTTEQLWHTSTKAKARVLEILPTDKENEFDLILTATCFYPEGGGQVGDRGIISAGKTVFEVRDTQLAHFSIVKHRGMFRGIPFEPGTEVTLEIDEALREATRKNHTATHLLHAALRRVLGSHVKQQGSLVAPDRLRFDFSHFGSLTLEEKIEIENLVNERILKDSPVEIYETTKREAEEAGAIAFFGEKYGERVRVVHAGDFSTELCGGTHVSSLGMIGMFYIVSETSIGANTRRIEATTGLNTLAEMRSDETILQAAANKLHTSKDQLFSALEKLEQSEAKARQAAAKLKELKIAAEVKRLESLIENGTLVIRSDGYQAEELRSMATQLLGNKKIDFAAIVSLQEDGKVSLAAGANTEKGYNAKEAVTAVSTLLGGGGGGSPALAVAGGKSGENITEILDALRSFVQRGTTH